MQDLESYLNALIQGCRSAFGDRLLYVGLQGSHLRGEAGADSDIDVVILLDRLTVRDLDAYREVLMRIGDYERSCGFICGREEMARWNPLEVCQLRHATKDLFGALEDFLPPATREDEINYVRLSLGNLYHAICHRYIHAGRRENEAGFRDACKSAFFLIQNMHYLESGRFLNVRAALMEEVPDGDREILALAERAGGPDFDRAFSALFTWCQRAFARVSGIR